MIDLLLFGQQTDTTTPPQPVLVGGGLRKATSGAAWGTVGFSAGIVTAPTVGTGGELVIALSGGTQVAFGSATVDKTLADRQVTVAVEATASSLKLWFYKKGVHVGANNSAVVGGTTYVTWVMV